MKLYSFKKFAFMSAAALLSGTMAFSVALPMLQHGTGASAAGSVSTSADGNGIYDITGSVDTDLSRYYDSSVVQKLPEAVKSDEEISVILSLDTETVLDGYNALGSTEMTVGEYAAGKEGSAISAQIESESSALQRTLQRRGVSFTLGNSYDTLLGGFEVNILARDFEKLCKAVEGKAGVMVGEVYSECVTTKVYENDVNVYDTGIFDSSESEYDGSGTVIAVLDTGLDYTHSAFAESEFHPTADDRLTLENISDRIDKLTAARSTPGLTAQSVYISRKVPYGYDYADKDYDVAPINSEHGTHVAGIMVGKDKTITGVAPNAQLAVMKVFSEKDSGAKQSWILAALEDCITLDVDVINMSLGTSAGFSREVDGSERELIYERVRRQGISLVCAASNDYNSTFGSEKNGNLGLTTNPDSATVGAPSTYEAALSVASISGVRTPYLLYNGSIIYFTESADRASQPKHFVDDILKPDEKSHVFDYVTIPGVGRDADYLTLSPGDIEGKIFLIKRGQTNFEEKARIGFEHGAAGVIIYNNVSGDITMTVGSVKGAVCSVSKDDGERLVTSNGGRGKITISRDQTAGPYMSDFSSWGPTPDLGIKPEITAHGGDIYSAVPGGGYDRLSGTSMASPNQAGVTALVRQYVKENFKGKTSVEVAAIVNQLMMSTADIAINDIGLPFSVRKQGAGLANLDKATHTESYISTYDRKTDRPMDKAKIELGDDAKRTGEYTFRFDIVNISQKNVSYRVDATVMTEGVSEQLTAKGARTVTQKGYILEGAKLSIGNVEGGSVNGDVVSVGAGKTVTVTATIKLSESDKQYLETSFANGMYVEGFVTLEARGEAKVSLNVPFLAYYGSWSEPPLFDLDYFATNRDELDDSIDVLEKTLPDAYATRPIGGLYDDYIVYLGSYAYIQDPASTSKISADRDRIALSNQEGEGGTVNSISDIWCGLLRNAKKMVATITDTVTGEVVFTKTVENQRKSYNYGGAISFSNVDIDFHVRDYDLQNNTKYLFRLQGFIDYEDGTVAGDTFEFPFYTDFSAPVVTDVQYSYEFDKETNSNRLYANVSIFDNHYVQGFVAGYIGESEDASSSAYTLYGFGRYVTPVVGERNSTNLVKIELTDYLDDIMNKSYNGRSFIIQAMDYAGNTSTYEIPIPDTVNLIRFPQEEIEISPNQTYLLEPEIVPGQSESWRETLRYTISRGGEEYVNIVNGRLVGLKPSGDTVITVTATAGTGDAPPATLRVKVLGENDPGYHAYDATAAQSFGLTGYRVNKVFAFMSSDDRDLGTDENGTEVEFSDPTAMQYLSMYPSESVTLHYDFKGYYPDSSYEVVFSSSDEKVVSVTQDGTITALNIDDQQNHLNLERTATVSVRLRMKDKNGAYKNTGFSRTVIITVKECYTTNGPYLMSYFGLGGTVVIPEEFGVTEIYQYAFSNYTYVPKDLEHGDVIDEEDPYASKITYIGDNTIKKVVIPDGVEVIQAYAFANLTALEEVEFPSTLTKIQTGAFYGCRSLRSVRFRGSNNLQFINQDAFNGCVALPSFAFDSIIAVGDRAFRGTSLLNPVLPTSAQSIGSYAFADNRLMSTVDIRAPFVKVGEGAFSGCSSLVTVSINASVIPANLFYGCSTLTSVKLGKDVAVLAQSVLRGTNVSSLTIDRQNPFFEYKSNGSVVEKGTNTLVMVLPNVSNYSDENVETIGQGAFSSASKLSSVTLPKVKNVPDYAFAGCASLNRLQLGKLESIGVHAFEGTSFNTMPELAEGVTIGDYAFAGANISRVTIPDGAAVGASAFEGCGSLRTVTVGNGSVAADGTVNYLTVGENAFRSCLRLNSVTVGNYVDLGRSAFEADLHEQQDTSTVVLGGERYNVYVEYYRSAMTSLSIGNGTRIGEAAFAGAGCGNSFYSAGASLTSVTLGKDVELGDRAFSGAQNISSIDLSGVKSIGSDVFSGDVYFYVYREGVRLIYGYTIANESAKLTEATLTSVETIKDGAFRDITTLRTVTIGEKAKSIGASAFDGCTALTGATLGGALEIGSRAFAGTALTSVTLSEGAIVGDEAFAGCASLSQATGLGHVKSIGRSAFEGAALTEADLTDVETIGSYAFRDTKVANVIFGSNLVSIGENPFSGCDLHAFENGEGASDYEIAEGISVIGGVLYRTAPNGGLEVVCYPTLREGQEYTVESGTVRIGGQAFRGAHLLLAELPREVKAIGDGAFLGCYDLMSVVFHSMEAPILEEQYDYLLDGSVDENGDPYYSLYAVGNVIVDEESDGSVITQGAGVVPYLMWNSDPTTVLSGSNFVDYIGRPDGMKVHEETYLMMVCPSNGTGYDNYIYGKYFDARIKGELAASDETAELMRLIDLLPSNAQLTLDDEAQVQALLSRFNALDDEQQLVVKQNNYRKLSEASNFIEALKNQQGGDGNEPTPSEPAKDGCGSVVTSAAVCLAILTAAVLAFAVVRAKKSSESSERK